MLTRRLGIQLFLGAMATRLWWTPPWERQSPDWLSSGANREIGVPRRGSSQPLKHCKRGTSPPGRQGRDAPLRSVRAGPPPGGNLGAGKTVDTFVAGFGIINPARMDQVFSGRDGTTKETDIS